MIHGEHTPKLDFDGLRVQVWTETTVGQTWEARPSDTSLSLSQSPERPAALGRRPQDVAPPTQTPVLTARNPPKVPHSVR